MSPKDDNAPKPTGGAEDNGGANDEAEKAGHERLWSSPIGVGTPIPFDPTKFKPPLSDEEVKKLLEEDKG